MRIQSKLMHPRDVFLIVVLALVILLYLSGQAASGVQSGASVQQVRQGETFHFAVTVDTDGTPVTEIVLDFLFLPSNLRFVNAAGVATVRHIGRDTGVREMMEGVRVTWTGQAAAGFSGELTRLNFEAREPTGENRIGLPLNYGYMMTSNGRVDFSRYSIRGVQILNRDGSVSGPASRPRVTVEPGA